MLAYEPTKPSKCRHEFNISQSLSLEYEAVLIQLMLVSEFIFLISLVWTSHVGVGVGQSPMHILRLQMTSPE